jgi:DNA-binding NarL/FixJ family response regulator
MTQSATGPSRPIRIVLADDYPMLRQAIEVTISDNPDLVVVGHAGNGKHALELCGELKPDVLVLDLMLPEMDGFEVARRLREEGSDTKILILTARIDSEALLEAMRLEVDGYLDKTVAIANMSDAIEAVANGVRLFTPEQERAAISEFGQFVRRARETSHAAATVTPREREVLDLICEGLTARQMATRLRVSQRTVEAHISKLYAKLGVKTRVQAMARGRQLGLVAPPD